MVASKSRRSSGRLSQGASRTKAKRSTSRTVKAGGKSARARTRTSISSRTARSTRTGAARKTTASRSRTAAARKSSLARKVSAGKRAIARKGAAARKTAVARKSAVARSARSSRTSLSLSRSGSSSRLSLQRSARRAGKMTRQQAGRLGGEARAEKYSKRELSLQAKKGARTIESIRPGFHSRIGQKGGIARGREARRGRR